MARSQSASVRLDRGSAGDHRKIGSAATVEDCEARRLDRTRIEAKTTQHPLKNSNLPMRHQQFGKRVLRHATTFIFKSVLNQRMKKRGRTTSLRPDVQWVQVDSKALSSFREGNCYRRTTPQDSKSRAACNAPDGASFTETPADPSQPSRPGRCAPSPSGGLCWPTSPT